MPAEEAVVTIHFRNGVLASPGLRCVLGVLLGLAGASPGAAATSPPQELVIYTYDSLVAKKGLGPEIFPLFEKKCGCKLKIVASGDGGQLLTRLQLDAERKHPTAQIALGLDQATWERAKPWLESWNEGGGRPWEPRGYSKVVPLARVEPGFLPLDYGVFAFIADQDALMAAKLSAPTRLSDLLKPEWRRNLILEDPRTSTPGLAFLLYADQVRGAGAEGFWTQFKSQWLTLTPGWDGAYGLFLKKEAPLVWSYTTSQAYHEVHGDPSGPARRYRALVFEEGQPLQIEGAALVKGSDPKLRALARSFLEFLLTTEVQSRIPLKNWMYPVIEGVALPESFQHLPKPHKIVKTPVNPVEIERALTEWKRAVGSAR
jgi:thiamine transport system substrate-binding protein